MPSSVITKAAFSRLFDKRLTKVFEDEYKSLPAMIPTLYNVINSDSAYEEYFDVGAVPDIPRHTGVLQYLSIAPGFHTKIEPAVWAGGLQFERELLDDKKYSVFDNRTKGLAESANRVQEKYGVRPFANAFSSAFDFMIREEGVSLCSSSHTTKAGVSTSSGFSNSGTSALSPTSVAATRILMRKFKNDIGERIEVNPDTLVVPDSLYYRALEIVGTPKSLDTAEGNINPMYQGFKVIPYLRLDDYDSNNWYMVDSKMMKRCLIWINRIKPEFNTNIDPENFYSKVSVYFRCGNGFIDWKWLCGHNVS